MPLVCREKHTCTRFLLYWRASSTARRKKSSPARVGSPPWKEKVQLWVALARARWITASSTASSMMP